ncbi:MAG: dienelactone hydrolase family protein [Gammaproteobacteria bacterium]|jgi:carboxymethylenebutenolidase
MNEGKRIEAHTAKIDEKLNGYYAAPAQPQAAILVLMEAFGITGHIRGVCDRLAGLGFAALAPDIFHGRVFAYDDMDAVLPFLKSLDEDAIMNETGRALAWLRNTAGMPAEKTGAIGFCLGGRLAGRAAIEHADQLGAAVSCYGGGIAAKEDRFGRAPLTPDFDRLRAPWLLVYGAEDGSIGPDEHGRIAQALSERKKRFCLSLYPEAGHGFLCEERASYAPDAAARAWPEITGFLGRNL